MAQVNADTVIAAYVKLRDKRSELKAGYEAADAELKEKMGKLEAYLLKAMQEQGITQLGSGHGTAYQQIVMKGSCSDWPSFWNFMAESGRFDMTEKRIAMKAVQQYHEETGELPPGVNISQELKVVVRRG